MSQKTNPLVLFIGGVLLAGAGFVAGMTVNAGGLGDLLNPPAESMATGESRAAEAETPAVFRERIRELEARLEKAEAKAEADGKDTGKSGGDKDLPGESGGKGMTKGEKAEWARKKKGGTAWAGKKGKKDWKPGLPEGMTKEEQDRRVREIVDRLDWPKFADAIATWGRADRGGRGVTVEEKETLGGLFRALGELTEVGVDFFDRRVARRFVPAMVSSLGANLDDQQAEQITGFVDETARQEENEPEPNPPLRYAQEKARDIRNTLDLEARMESILRPEQFREYLAEVGEDPFRSGFGFKTQRMACAGANADAVAVQVTDLWAGDWYGLEEHRTGIATIAQRFVTDALALPVPAEGLEPAARRRAILERTMRRLELQGRAEQEILATLPLSEAQRLTMTGSEWPVLDLVIE